MKEMLLIIKKELVRVFTDRRMLASLIFPGLLIFILYAIMGNVMKNVSSVDDDYSYQVYAIYEDCSQDGIKFAQDLLKNYNITYLNASNKTVTEIKEEIKNKEIDLLVIYKHDLMDLEAKPEVSLYYNSVKVESNAIYQNVLMTISAYESANLEDLIKINTAEDTYDLASLDEINGSLYAMLLPMLLIIFAFSGVMGIVPDSIAGEKERGTMATLLVTPVKRHNLALGKLISVSIISLVSAVSSFLGTILSLPFLGSSQMSSISFSNLNYGFLDYLYILLIIITMILLFVGMLSIVSAVAKSVKEANSYSTPIMIVVLVIAIISMFNARGGDSSISLYFIPVYNCALALSNILAYNVNLIGILITIISNIVYTVLLAVVIARLFNSERIMFRN